jgi:Ca-activated chloride channel family protein
MNQYRAQYRRVDRDKVQADITNIALDHHLVSKFTSLVAVDITPTKPGSENIITKSVANKVKAAKTATNSQLWMMLGLVIILLSVVTRRREQS